MTSGVRTLLPPTFGYQAEQPRATGPAWLGEVARPIIRARLVARLRQLRNPGSRFGKVFMVGCGDGDFALRLLALADRVIGVDIDPGAVSEARCRAMASPRRHDIEFRLQNAVDIHDFDGADLVCIGPCVRTLTNHDLERLLGRVAGALPETGVVHVRARVAPAVVRGGDASVRLNGRTASDFEQLFVASNLRVRERYLSSSLLAATPIKGRSGHRAAPPLPVSPDDAELPTALIPRIGSPRLFDNEVNWVLSLFAPGADAATAHLAKRSQREP